MKNHKHKVVARLAAAALGTHGTIRFEDCSCGTFRLRSVSKWIEPANSREALTIAQVCEFLHCGYDVVYRLIWKGLVIGRPGVAGLHGVSRSANLIDFGSIARGRARHE